MPAHIVEPDHRFHCVQLIKLRPHPFSFLLDRERSDFCDLFAELAKACFVLKTHLSFKSFLAIALVEKMMDSIFLNG